MGSFEAEIEEEASQIDKNERSRSKEMTPVLHEREILDVKPKRGRGSLSKTRILRRNKPTQLFGRKSVSNLEERISTLVNNFYQNLHKFDG